MLKISNPSKVCMIAHTNYYIDGRVQQYVKALVAKGISVDIICAHSLITARTPIEPLVKVYPLPIAHQEAGLLRLSFEYFIGMLFYTLYLLFLYLVNHYPIIHVHNMPNMLVFCTLIPKIMGAKIILDVHDPMPEFFQAKFQQSTDHWLYKLILLEEQCSASLADHLITVNFLCKHNLIQRNIPQEKITVIMNQPDPTIFKRKDRSYEKAKQKSSFTLIFIGTIATRYSLEIAIQALPCLKQQIPAIRLLIVGKGSFEYCSALLELAKELKVSQHLEIRPPVPIMEIPDLLDQADVGIYTALPNPHMNIAIPEKVIEYSIMGLPIVTSRLTVLEDFFPRDGVLFFEPGNIKDFCEQVLKLHQQPELRQKMINTIDNSILITHSLYAENNRYYHLLSNLGLPIQGGNE